MNIIVFMSSERCEIVGYLITVCATFSVSQNLRSSTYTVTIIPSVIGNTVECRVPSAKTWCQSNLDFIVFLNRRITIFRKLNIYNLLRD